MNISSTNEDALKLVLLYVLTFSEYGVACPIALTSGFGYTGF